MILVRLGAWLLPLALLLDACSAPTQVSKFPRLDEATDHRESHQIAIELTRNHFARGNENPHDYYLLGIREVEGILLLDLSYQNDFERQYNNTLGNRSGKSRSCEYDPSVVRITKCLLWQ